MKRNRIYKSLRNSFWDGVFASVMIGFTESYITPFALAMKASAQAIGLLSSIPNLVSSFFQLKAADITEWLGSRKRIINIFIFIHSFMLLPILSLPYFVASDWRITLLILFVTIYQATGALTAPAWGSLMSDHIPQNKRGRYFAWRNRICAAIIAAASFLAGAILNLFHRGIFGFTIIFALAMASRLISWHFLNKMFEPPLRSSREAYFSFFNFIRKIRESNFAKFTLFAASMNFAVHLAAPFFAVYMLKDLGFSYIKYTTVVVTAGVANLATIGIWGHHADKAGNMRVIKFASILIPAIPCLWLFSHNLLYLVVVQIYAGALWAGFNLCVSNFIYDAVSPEKRTRCISYFNVISGACIFAGALSGGFLATRVPSISGYRLLTLFLISGILRALVGLIFLPKIKEVRNVEHVSSLELFYSIIGIRPI